MFWPQASPSRGVDGTERKIMRKTWETNYYFIFYKKEFANFLVEPWKFNTTGFGIFNKSKAQDVATRLKTKGDRMSRRHAE